MVIPRAGGNGVQSVQFRDVRGQNWGEFGGRWPFSRTYTSGSFYPDHKPFLPTCFLVSRPNPQSHCLYMYRGSILSKAQITNRCGSPKSPRGPGSSWVGAKFDPRAHRDRCRRIRKTCPLMHALRGGRTGKFPVLVPISCPLAVTGPLRAA